MSEVSILGKKWIDLVFEGKNKSYGAYQLRQENPRTTLTAFFFGILLIGSLSAGGFLLSSFSSKPAAVIPETPELYPATDVITVVNLTEKVAPKPAAAPPKAPENKTNAAALEVAKPIEKPDEVKPNTQSTVSAPSNPESTGTTTTVAAAAPTGTTATPAAPEGPYRKGALDVQPKFPGGIEKFYSYVGNNFEKAEMETGKKLTVIVSFVIERDGSMSDIKVVQNPGEGLDKEAIRVLKGLKTKWAPGIKDGEKVRTAYTLPITVIR